MAQSNHERVGKALEVLNSGLKPFVEREMLAKYGPRWQSEAVTDVCIGGFTPALPMMNFNNRNRECHSERSEESAPGPGDSSLRSE